MISPLSNWPRYPGGAIAGLLLGLTAVLLFFVPSLRPMLPIALLLVALLSALRSR